MDRYCYSDIDHDSGCEITGKPEPLAHRPDMPFGEEWVCPVCCQAYGIDSTGQWCLL